MKPRKYNLANVTQFYESPQSVLSLILDADYPLQLGNLKQMAFPDMLP